MLVPRLLTQHTSEAMHVQGNDSQSNTSGKSLSTFRPNTVEATVFKIVDPRFSSWVETGLEQFVDVGTITVFGQFKNGSPTW